MFLFILPFVGCFSCTMEGGFRIYNVEPLSEKARVGELFYAVCSTAQNLINLKVKQFQTNERHAVKETMVLGGEELKC